MKKLLAVASGGGHWKQLMLISSAFEDCDVKYVTTIRGLPEQSGIEDFVIVKDSNKDEKASLFVTLLQVFLIVVRFRPDYVISTGAAPGIFAIFFGRILGAKTLWIDSIANGEELSLGGRLAKKYSTVVLSQWQSLADDKVEYKGGVY